MKFLAEIDARLIEMVQEIYLWLWDRTGLFVGALTVSLALGATWLTVTNVWAGLLLAAIFSLHGMALIWVQGLSLGAFNSHARHWRRNILRTLLIVYNAAALLTEAWDGHLGHVAACLLIIVAALYLPCVQIRDREPPEKLSFASEGA